ncbi:MAG: trigger factor [Anaerolineae bacterium]|nr:trigger factor [Anaerolineae bacterium]
MFEVNKELLESHEALLTVTVDEETFNKSMRKAARAVSREVMIPGFRKGKAPYTVVVQRVGEEFIREQAAEDYINNIYAKVIDEAEVAPYDSGAIEDISFEPLTYKIRIPLSPEVDLGDYKSLRVDYESPTVTDADIERALENIRQHEAILDPVERPAELGDQVYLTVKGMVEGANEVFIDEEDLKLVLRDGSDNVLIGFDEAIVGLELEEETTFTLPIPDDFEVEAWHGDNVTFEVKVSQIYERTLPELDDALASTVGAYETLDELKEALYQQMSEYKTRQVKEEYQERVLMALTEQSQVLYPPIALEQEIDDILKEMKERFKHENNMELEDALSLQGITAEAFREQLKPQAVIRLERGLVIGKLMLEEKIKATDESVMEQYHELLSSIGIDKQNPLFSKLDLNSPVAQSMRSSVQMDQALEYIEKLGRGLLESESPMGAEVVAEVSTAEDIAAGVEAPEVIEEE